MSAPERIRELVERFERNRDSYESDQYKETQLRREFLDPFFEELGWDVQNRNGWSEAYKEVIHEDAITIGAGKKAPDYSFRIGGTRKFFVEAKRPSVNIRLDISPSYQLRRYAWSAKLPLSLLTDFGEFAVYDTRIRPNPTDSAATARTMYLTCRDYLTKWPEIADIFHRESVLRGSFDRYAESTKVKKGTAEVDDQFLSDIEAWRETLARNLALRNSDLDTRDLNFAVQKIIDRIIFLRICEDRAIEPYGRLRDLTNGEGIYQRLRQMFVHADDRYNSGLFHFNPEKGRNESPDTLTPTLVLDDKPLRDILRGLYYPDSPYEFSVIPAEILGHVYEQFLGKVIRLTAGHRAVVEDKPEVKKAGGVYYTPTYVVDFIVRETLTPLLEGRTPKQVSKLRIIDPACGSGSFLIGAYQFLLDWHRDSYLQSNDRKRIYQAAGGEWRLTTAERKRILTQCIFGVDIDPQAVEVTKLSLLLKVLEGESSETLKRQLRLFHERALPDLGNNIKSGNSLIGPEFGRSELFDIDTALAANPFDWKHEFRAVFADGGFDAVIGNPPYIRAQRIERLQAEYLFSRYRTATSKADLSVFFIEKALELVHPDGFVGFISTSQWLSTDYGKNLRQALRGGQLHKIIDFGSLPVFRRASTYPAIFIFRRKLATVLEYRRVESVAQLSVQGIAGVRPKRVKLKSLTDAPWNLRGFNVLETLKRSNRVWRPLNEFGRAYIGTKSGSAEAFIVSHEYADDQRLERQLLFPYAYQAGEVFGFRRVTPSDLLIYPYREGDDGQPVLLIESELATRYPNIHRHLLGHKEDLRKRLDSRRLYATGADWFRHLRPGSFSYIRPRKLSMRSLARRAVTGWLDPNTAFDGANCPSFVMNSDDRRIESYFLGLLNSKAVAYYLRTVSPPKLGGYMRFSATYINQIPIPDPDDSANRGLADEIVSVTDQLVSLHARPVRRDQGTEATMLQRQTDARQRSLDTLVFELYGFSETERSEADAAIPDEL